MICFERSPLYLNLFIQVGSKHLNGFSPEDENEKYEIYISVKIVLIVLIIKAGSLLLDFML